METRKAKKIRKMYKKAIVAEARRKIDGIQGMIREKPFLLPKWIWKRFVHYVLGIKIKE